MEPYEAPEKYPDQVVLYKKLDAHDEFWFTTKRRGVYTWQQMTKYSRAAPVLAFLKDPTKHTKVIEPLRLDCGSLTFSNDADLMLSLHGNEWAVQLNDVEQDKKYYNDVTMFATDKPIRFKHTFCAPNIFIDVTFDAPHTVKSFCDAFIDACQKKFKGYHIWNYSDHIYPESLTVSKSNKLEVWWGS